MERIFRVKSDDCDTIQTSPLEPFIIVPFSDLSPFQQSLESFSEFLSKDLSILPPDDFLCSGAPSNSMVILLLDHIALTNSELVSRILKTMRNSDHATYFCLTKDSGGDYFRMNETCRFLGQFHDIFVWPCSVEEMITRAMRFHNICRSAQQSIETELAEQFSRLNLVGHSPIFLRTLGRIKKIARCDVPVLIEGETGTGKENSARAIHYLSDRSDRAFIPVNCGALPDELLENELFGHKKGAFTDAKSNQGGLIELADGGTLFLDEVDSLTPKAQAALLRFLQTLEYRPLGSKTLLQADVRILSASNADLAASVRQQRFREDLLFRLNVLNVYMPPLRERSEDIIAIAQSLLSRFAYIHNRSIKHLSPAAIDWLHQQRWPGNVRELENTLLRQFLLTEDDFIYPECHSMEATLPRQDDKSDFAAGNFHQAKAAAIEHFEQRFLTHLLTQTEGNISEAARIAGKERRALGKLIKKHKIDRTAFFDDSRHQYQA